MRFYIFIAICFCQIASPILAEGQYTIIGPGTLHSARPYNVAVTTHHATGSSKLIVGITGPSYNETKTIDVSPNESKMIIFEVPVLEKGSYNLTAEGVEGIIFKNTTKLNYADPMPIVKIQTDKGMYKPGDVINFRVLFLDENLRPRSPLHNTVVYIEDDKRNRIKEYKNIDVVKGVYTGQFILSEYAMLGHWRLMVQSGGDWQTATAYFEVAKYVLPKYEIKVEATDNVAVQDGDLQVIARANYTYGKPFNGKVTLLIKMEPAYYYYNSEDNEESTTKKDRKDPPSIVRTADMVNGKAKFDLNVKEYEEYMPQKTSPAYLTITADVEENFTGVKLNATTTTTLYPYRYFMNCKSYETCSTYKANKEFEVLIQVMYIDYTEIKDTKSIVKLLYKEGLRKNNWFRYSAMNSEEQTTTTAQPPVSRDMTFEFTSHMNASGVATFKVTLPELEEFEDYFHFFDMEMEYAGERRHIQTTYQHREPKNTNPKPPVFEEPKDYFDIQPKYEKDKYTYTLDDEVTIAINSSVPMSYFVYNVIGRGNILISERVNLPDKQKLHEIKLKPSFLMAPYGRVYVFYVDDQGELHYAETTFSVKVELQNQLEITSAAEVKPGEDVALHIKTPPNSFVGLLAIDQSVIQLRENNDVHANDFRWRLGSFDTHTPWQGGYSRYPGSYTGVVTLTNAFYFYNWTDPGHNLKRAYLEDNVSNEVVKLASAPMAPSAAGFVGGANKRGDSPNIPVRKDFSETWIFDNIENTETEEFTWKKKIPDTITSWLISGFSLHPDKGLGVTKDRTKIITFQPFFISIRLPYSVKRGEVISVPALVFNYLEKDLDVEITLDNSDGEYEFTDVSNEVINEEKRSKTIKVPANSAVGASFILRPTVIGNIMLKFTAVSAVAGDAIHKTLKVIPEGVTEYANRAYFVNLKNASEFKETFELSLPEDIVPDSQHVEFGVVGDLLGPLLKNFDHLVRLPMGCGEQTVSKMVPNYFVLRYLQSINKLTPALESKIKRNVEVGYQHILTYRHDDGSFSSFGPVTLKDEKPRNGSTWLSAYVLRTLQQIDGLVKVDAKILKEGLDYLATKQAENGSFVDDGDFYYATQRNHITLTANVLQAFLENKTMAENYQSQIDKGFKFILENLEKTEDLHAKAVAVYTLQKANHAPEEIKKAISALKDVAKSDADRMWWSHSKEISNLWWRWSFSNDVEITSYMLLTLLNTESETVDSVLPIIRWLVAQRNNYGGFSSTQDTVVGLQALIKFAQKSEYEAATMKVDVSGVGGNEDQQTIQVNDDNALLLQTVELAPKTNKINFEAQGKGAALIQISYQYNVAEKEKKPSFSVETVVKEDTPAFKFEMEVCVDYVGEGEASNMAVLEISLPSGYTADVESFDGINAVDGVRLTETKNSDSVIVVYFESLRKNDVKCLPIQAYKSFAVALQKPSPVALYDYYDTTKKTTEYYKINSKLCDLCEERDSDECSKHCK